MGQNSSPIISKLGLTMYWNNMWDDKLNFSKKLKEDILINMFLFLIFTGCTYHSNCFYSSNNFYFTQSFFLKSKLPYMSYYNDFVVMDQKNNIYFVKPLKIKYKIHYIGKIWILKFQNWLLLIFHLYAPQTKKYIKKSMDEDSFFFKKNTKSYKMMFFKKNKYSIKNLNQSFFSAFFYNWYLFNLMTLKLNVADKFNTFNFLH